jgi:predicted O-methyltransferase YrrM
MLSGASPRQTLITIEGSEKLSQIATRHFDQFGFAPRQIHADFQAAMETEIDWPSFHPNFVLLDGNHRYAPTVQYFEFLLQKVAKGAIIVLDDIYWSTEMTAAWQQIIAHPRVSVSVDLYALGICFLDRPQAKEHFTLRFRAW